MNDIERAELENYIEQKRRGLHKLIDGTFDGIRAQLCPSGPEVALRLRLANVEAEIVHIKRQLRVSDRD
jgi:hypothetical protein